MIPKTIHTNNSTLRINFLLVIFVFVTSSGLTSCNFQSEDKKVISVNKKFLNDFPYDLQNPDIIYKLPAYLEEISGISHFKNNKIACIQDEQAIIYIFDTKKGKIISKIDFGKKGDYEDIAVVKHDAYVLRSDGTLFKVENFEESEKIKALKIKTPLNSRNDTEGLVFDKKTNSLLIACKASAYIDKERQYNGYKSIYKFDLKKNKLNEEPFLLIDLSVTDSIKVKGRIEKFSIETAKKLNLLKDSSSFHPSGLAIHPFNNNLYIISSVEKLLIIMNESGNIVNILKLNNRLFNQPEGISFSKSGDLFISNEKKHTGGNVLKFSHRDNHIKKI